MFRARYEASERKFRFHVLPPFPFVKISDIYGAEVGGEWEGRVDIAFYYAASRLTFAIYLLIFNRRFDAFSVSICARNVISSEASLDASLQIESSRLPQLSQLATCFVSNLNSRRVTFWLSARYSSSTREEKSALQPRSLVNDSSKQLRLTFAPRITS